MNKLRDDMYLAVTGSIFITSFTYSEFKQIKCTAYASEHFEYWSEEMLFNHVTALVDNILSYFISPTNK